jgi:flagellar hook-associated protein 1 FlgK
MGTINSALSIATGALDADQAALNVVANNVANANTTGYTEEKANFKENDAITMDGVVVGDGVSETGATSQRNRVLQERLDQQQQLESASSSRLSALDSIQNLFSVNTSSSSSGGDIGSDITHFFNSFTSLENEPTSTSYRAEVLSSATTLASDISSAAQSLNEQQTSLNQDAASVASQVNALTSSIAQLNQEITSTSPNTDAGTLEDQRQADISALSKLAGINQVTTENNGLEITTTSGRVLVDGNSSFDLTTGTVSGVTHFYLGTTDVTTELASGGGQLGGYLTARDTDIPNALASLDQLAYSISTEVNTVNTAGENAYGTAGTDIFYAPTVVAGSALTMAVTMTDSGDIAAAATAEGTGDSSNATQLAKLSSTTFVNGMTPSNYYSSFVSSLGSKVSAVKTENSAEETSVSQLQTQLDTLSSVNLDDEASSLTTMERSYQAASQTFTILSTLMEETLNMGTQTTV